MHPYLTEGNPRILAHRGASKAAPPGNCIAAIAAAVDAGVDHIETDVRTTADGQVVMFHDETLDEHTTGSGKLEDLTWAEASELFLRTDGETTEHKLLRLADALDAWPDLFWNIDIKTDPAVEPTLDLLRGRNLRDRVCVAAFSLRRIRRIRRILGEGWCTAFAGAELGLARAAAALHLPVPRFGDVVQAPPDHAGVSVVTQRFVDACHAQGIAVHTWTINDPQELHRLRNMGVDAIVTDQPEIAPNRWRTDPD